MNLEDVGLDDVFVALGVARVIAGVDETDVADVEGSVREDFELVLAQLRQVETVTAPHDRRTGRSAHVAFDLDVVTDTRR